MSLITQEEVEKVARLSHITLSQQELVEVMVHLDAVLSYAARVQDIAKDVDVPNVKNINIERQDTVKNTDPEKILAQAPEREGDYFVVPVIIEAEPHKL